MADRPIRSVLWQALALVAIVAGATAAQPAPGESQEQQRLSIRASLERKAIEKELDRDGEQLAEVRAKLSAVEGRPNVTEPWMEKSLGLGTGKSGEVKRLRDEQRRLAGAMIKTWERFDDLDRRVREAFGGAPDWWRKVSCVKCPSRSELGEFVE